MRIAIKKRATENARVPHRHADGRARPSTWRLTWGEGLALGVGVVMAVLVLRARANMVSCAFLTWLVPALLVAFSRTERMRMRTVVARFWTSLEVYASGGKTPWAAVLAFVVVPSTLLNLSSGHINPIGDTSCVVPTAISLLTEGNTDLDEFQRAGFWWAKAPEGKQLDDVSFFVRQRGGHLYPSHPSGMVSLTLPVVALAKLSGAKLADPIVQLRLEELTSALVGAASLGVFFLLALHLVRPAPALATTAILAVASGMLTTVGQNLWQHDGIILGSLSLLLLEFRNPGRRATLAQGLICGTLPAFRLTAVTFLVPFGAWILLRSPRRAIAILCLATLAYSPWALYYQSLYASPFGPTSTHMAGSNWSASAVSGRLASVVLSPGRGLLTYQPWILLAFTAVIPAVRRSVACLSVGTGPKGWMTVCVASLVLEVLVVSAWHCWWGGYCWGSRLVMSVVPLCALLCARPISALLTTLPGRSLLASLTLLGVLVQAPGAYTDSFRWNIVHAATPEQSLWSWSEAPFFAPINLPRR